MRLKEKRHDEFVVNVARSALKFLLTGSSSSQKTELQNFVFYL